MTSTAIVGSGHFLPPRVVTNDDLAQWMETSDDWIRTRTGIRQRRYIEPGTATSDLAKEAAEAALADAGCHADDVDLIIFATLSPDFFFPGSGVSLGAKLDIVGTPALDVRNQCSGFLYGLHVADGLIRSGIHQTILLVGAEIHSTGLDFSDEGRDIAVLFGDGAGAVVLQRSNDQPGIIRTELGADGRQENVEALWCRSPASSQSPQRITPHDLSTKNHFPQMDGRRVFKRAVSTLRDAVTGILQRTGTSFDDVALFIPHQANQRINDLVARALDLDGSRFYSNIERTGNTTAASIPIALDECRRQGRLAPGDLACFLAFGSGFTWGVSLVRM